MRNECLAIALRELNAAGVRNIEQVRGGKHLQLRWQVDGHGLRIYSVPGTPGDWRSPRNVRAEIRKLCKKTGCSRCQSDQSPRHYHHRQRSIA